jgi:hypothetical protein
MRSFLRSLPLSAAAVSLIIEPAFTGGCPPSYVQQAVHLDQGVIVGPINNLGFQASGPWTTSNNAVPVAGPPSSCHPGELVYDLSQATAGKARVGYVSSCGSTSITLTGNALHSGSSGDYLMLSGPIAAADSCQFTFSGWVRVPTLPTFYETMYSNDLISAGQTSSGGSENEMGIDLIIDNNGLRINAADYTGSHTIRDFFTSDANSQISAKLIGGQWNHILWSVNACSSTAKRTLYINGVQYASNSGVNPLSVYGVAQSTTASGSWAQNATTIALSGGSCPSGIAGWSVTDATYSPARYVGRVTSCSSGTVTLTGGALYASSGSSDSLQFNGGVNFSDMAGGFWLNQPSYENGMAVADWADVALWTGADLVCSHAPYNGSCPLGSGTTISASDLALFGMSVNGVWTPVSLNNAISTLGGGNNGINRLVAYFTGDSSTFASNTSPAVSATPISTVSTQRASTGVPQSLTSSASLVTASNEGGQPEHVPGYKWGCVYSFLPGPFALPTCGNAIAAGDILIGVTLAEWTSNQTSTACTPPTGAAGTFSTWNGAGGTYQNSGGFYQLVCAYYYTANATDARKTAAIPITTNGTNGGSYGSGSATFYYSSSAPLFRSGDLINVLSSSVYGLNNHTYALTVTASGNSGSYNYVTVNCNGLSACNSTGTLTANTGSVMWSGFGGGSISATQPNLREMFMLVDYANSSGVDTTTTPSGLTNYVSTTSVPISSGLTTQNSSSSNDLLLAIFTQTKGGYPTYTCPSGWTPRVNLQYSISFPMPLVCDKSVAPNTSITASSVAATMGTKAMSASGGLIAFKPN